MPDAAAMRSAVETMMTRLLAGGETELAEQLVHPEFVNNEADPERRRGPSGAAATSEWLRSCFGNLRYDIHRVFIDGDMAAAYVTMHGTHEGGLPPACLPRTSRSPSSTCICSASRTTVESLSTRPCAMTSAWSCNSVCCPPPTAGAGSAPG